MSIGCNSVEILEEVGTLAKIGLVPNGNGYPEY